MRFSKTRRAQAVRQWRVLFLLLLLLGLALTQLRCGENPLQPDMRGPNEIWIFSTGFDPPVLNIAAGTQVTWTNKDNTKHDATSGTPGNIENKFPPTKNLNPNETSDPVLFATKGTFNYFCLTHGNGHSGGVVNVQ